MGDAVICYLNLVQSSKVPLSDANIEKKLSSSPNKVTNFIKVLEEDQSMFNT